VSKLASDNSSGYAFRPQDDGDRGFRRGFSSHVSEARHSGFCGIERGCNCVIVSACYVAPWQSQRASIIVVNGGKVGGKWWPTPAELTASVQLP